MTRFLALHCAEDNIRVNCILPGPVTSTEIWHQMVSRNPQADPDQVTRHILERTVPMNRSGTPEDIARGALFLASPENTFVTGVALPVDGGDTAM